MNFSFVHEFDIAPAPFWEIFWSDDYTTDLFKAINVKSRTVLSYKEEGSVITRVQKVDPNTPVPGWATSVIKDTGYTEHGVYHKDRSLMDIRIEPAIMKDRFQMSGVYAVTPLPGDRCKREFRGEVKVSVPLIGGKIEKFMVDQLKDSYDIAARVTRDYVGRRKSKS